MRVTALLAWYDEDPEWLLAAVRSLDGLADHVVALDGAYALFPGGKAASDPIQHHAIGKAAREIGIGYTVHVPPSVFVENETEKRTELFRLGEPTEADWFYIVDTDELVTEIPAFRRRLQQTRFDVAEVSMREAGTVGGPARSFTPHRRPFRKFFRAMPGIKVMGNHFTYLTKEGRRLWGPGGRRLAPAFDLTDIEVLHRSKDREPERRAQQKAYYDKRDAEGIEIGTCERCGADAVKCVLGPWELKEGRPPESLDLEAEWVNVCKRHIETLAEERTESARSFGIDPETLRPLPKVFA